MLSDSISGRGIQPGLTPRCAVTPWLPVGEFETPIDQTCATESNTRYFPAWRNLHDTPLEPTMLVVANQFRNCTSAPCGGRHICIVPSSGLPGFLVTKDPGEVCPLSGGVRLQPLSTPLQGGLRFLPDPLRAVPSAPLRAAFPCGRTTRLPRFVSSICVGWVVPLRRWRDICGRGQNSPYTWPRTFWFKPVDAQDTHRSILGLSLITTFNSTSRELTRPRPPRPRPP